MSHYTMAYAGEAESGRISCNSLKKSADEDRNSRSISQMERVAAVKPSVIRTIRTKIGSAIIDVICFGVCICMFIFALMAYHANGDKVSSYEKKLMNIARIVSRSPSKHVVDVLLIKRYLGYDSLSVHICVRVRSVLTELAQLAARERNQCPQFRIHLTELDFRQHLYCPVPTQNFTLGAHAASNDMGSFSLWKSSCSSIHQR
jgi:hypothetical protein